MLNFSKTYVATKICFFDFGDRRAKSLFSNDNSVQ